MAPRGARLACALVALAAQAAGSGAVPLPRRPATLLGAGRSVSKIRGGADASGGAAPGPLPEGWTAHTDQHTGQVYYVNHADGERHAPRAR